MVVTPSGMSREVIVHSLKEPLPMITEAGNVEPLHPKIRVFVAVSMMALQLLRES